MNNLTVMIITDNLCQFPLKVLKKKKTKTMEDKCLECWLRTYVGEMGAHLHFFLFMWQMISLLMVLPPESSKAVRSLSDEHGE